MAKAAEARIAGMITDPLAAGESRFVHSVLNYPTRIGVYQYRRNAHDRRSIDSLYLRDPRSGLYERLQADDDRTSYSSPVSARDTPCVFFNVMRISDGGGGNWVHVARVDVRTRLVDVILTPEDLLLGTACAPEWPLHPWISGLSRVSDDGQKLVCTAGIPLPHCDGGCAMKYWFFEVDVDTRSLTWLTRS